MPLLRRHGASLVLTGHLVRPGPDPGDSPYHSVLVRVDGERLRLEVVGVDWDRDYRPYRSAGSELQQRGRRVRLV